MRENPPEGPSPGQSEAKKTKMHLWRQNNCTQLKLFNINIIPKIVVPELSKGTVNVTLGTS